MKVLLKLSRPTSMKNTGFTVGWSRVMPATMQVRECVVRGDWEASQEMHQKSPLEPRRHVLSHKGVLSDPDLETRLTFPPCRLLVFYHLSLGFVVFQ